MPVILLIEDDRCLRENTKEILELAGYKVLTANNGQEGVQLALSNRIDIILCDIIMPVLDGYSVLKDLSTVPETQKIPFIFLTAKSSLKEIRAGMNLGADDYLVKPFEEQELLETIQRRLEKFEISQKGKQINSPGDNLEIDNISNLKEYFFSKGEKISLSKNEMLFSENQLASYVYLIKKGLIKTFKIDEYGKVLITMIYRKDKFLGLYSLIGIKSYPECALAIEPSILYKIPSSFIQKAFKENPHLSIEWAQNLSENVLELNTQLLQTAYSSALRKTVNTLLNLSEKMNFEKEELEKISRTDLASVAGITKESFIRSLSILKSNGLINVKGKSIEIVNMRDLKNFQ